MPEDYRDIQEGLTEYVIAGTIIFLVLAALFLVFIVISLSRRRRLQQEKRVMQEQFKQELLRAQLEIHENTLKNVSLEIHDNIGQTLSLAKLNLATLILNSNLQTDEKIKDSHQLVTKAIHDLRGLSRSLDTDYVRHNGLLPSVAHELKLLGKAAEIETKLNLVGQPVLPGPEKSLIMFRIIQESLNNIIKHAEAKEISVNVEQNEKTLAVKIIDNGRGFDMTQVEAGLGIRNMQHRAVLIGARIDVESRPGRGTEIRLELETN